MYKFKATQETVEGIISQWSENGFLDFTLDCVAKNRFKPQLTYKGKVIMEMDEIQLSPGSKMTFEQMQIKLDFDL
jgi:hypothetical protein